MGSLCDTPTAAQVAAKRAVLLACQLWGVMRDQGLHLRAATIMNRLGLREIAAPAELVLLDTPDGAVSQQDVINASWGIEGIQVLLWALGKTKKPEPTEGARDIAEFFKMLRGQHRTSAFIAMARLLPKDEIVVAEDITRLWLWRAREYQLQRREGFSAEARERVAAVAKQAEEKGYFNAIDGDFPVDGRPYRDIPIGRWQELRSIATERTKALRWLLGVFRGEYAWHGVSLDT